MELWAQMPSATTEEVNHFIWGLAALSVFVASIFVGLAAAKAFFARKPAGDQYVSKGELKALQDSVDSDMNKMSTAIEACATKTEVEKLSEQLRLSVQPMAIAIARMETKQEGHDRQITVLANKIDGSHDLLVEIRGIVRKNGQEAKTA